MHLGKRLYTALKSAGEKRSIVIRVIKMRVAKMCAGKVHVTTKRATKTRSVALRAAYAMCFMLSCTLGLVLYQAPYNVSNPLSSDFLSSDYSQTPKTLGANQYKPGAHLAFAEDAPQSDPATPQAIQTDTQLQAQIEKSAQVYQDVSQSLATLDATIHENQDNLSAIQSKIPEARKAAAQAIRINYKMQQSAFGILDVIFASRSFEEFVSSLMYFSLINTQNQNAIEMLEVQESDAQKLQAELVNQREALTLQQKEAKEALDEAQATRKEAQKRAEEQNKQAVQHGEVSQVPASVDWSQDKQNFVASWRPRIDAYLGGSPLAGFGGTFAASAWDFGIDPRLSPAIAQVESSLGAACSYPYNAWGWGNSQWVSWDAAIPAHVAGLARSYGSTLTYAMAQKYCPLNPGDWYGKVLAQMNRM